MSRVNLIRLGGLAAILAGILRAVAAFLPNTAPGPALELLYLLIDVLLICGVMSLYVAQHEEVGGWGFAGFLLSVIGILIIRSNKAVSGVNLYPVGALVFLVGLNLLVVCSCLANKLPRWIAALLLLSMAIGVAGNFLPGSNLPLVLSGVLFGIGFAGVGLRMWSAAHQTQTV